MSINVTVTGNPINIRRGRMVLSDLDLIKKSEVDRRRRLRLKQVRQQSKEISNRLLERAKLIEQQELDKLENDKDSEFRLLYNDKIRNIQQKYQEDMENIGQAHTLAAEQLNVDEIVEINKEKNKAAAVERGKEAAQRLKELNKKKDDHRLAQQERLQKVRETENIRAAMVSQLPKTSHVNEDDRLPDSIQNEDNITDPSIKAKNVKPVKAVVHQTDNENTIQSCHCNQKKNTTVQSKKTSDKTKHVVVDVSNVPRTVVTYESDPEPRRMVPVINLSSNKADKITRYNPDDYRQHTTESDCTSSSSSISNDSSYFSDNGEQLSKKKSKHPTTSSFSKVQMYDLTTRQRNLYNMPTGLVEKIDIRNEPNAQDRARELRKSESQLSQLSEKRKLAAENRGKDAILREKVRRDYKTLVQNLDDLCREERKLKASQIHGSPNKNLHMHPRRKKECQKKRQRKMERVLESALRSVDDTSATLGDMERIITITPRNDTESDDILPPIVQQKKSFSSTTKSRKDIEQRPDEEISRNEQILEMLKKVERQKFLLLREYGANLPESIFNVSLRPLFDQLQPQPQPQVQGQVQQEQQANSSEEKLAPSQKTLSPEIRVINVSNCEDAAKVKPAKPKKKQKPPQLIEAAVQTSVTEEGQDKSVQVELSCEKNAVPEEKQHPVEPVVTIITPKENVESSSNSSFVPDIVIDMSKQQVKVTPKKKKSSDKKTSLTISKKSFSSPSKRSTKSVPTSRFSSPKKMPTEQVASPCKRDFSQMTSIESSSTESSRVYSTPETGPSEGAPYRLQTHTTRKIIKIKDTSDSSTSYASPPVMQPGTLISALNYSTPILEMLDSSAAETYRQKKTKVSPVSTPETPSPRTMRLPSNMPRSERINRTLFKQMQQNQETSTEKVVMQKLERNQYTSALSKQQKQLAECSCKNPTCKLFHAKKLDQIDEFLLKNCPEVARKFEELQMTSAEKIASLSHLIERLRTDRGTELSTILPIDENQLTAQSLANTNIETVRNIINSIENVHSKLVRTLHESEKLISEGTQRSDIIFKSPSPQRLNGRIIEKALNIKHDKNDGDKEQQLHAKLKIVSDKNVHINLDRFKASQKLNDGDDIVKKLSIEILEQSKSVDKSRESSKAADDSGKKQDKEPAIDFVLSKKKTLKRNEVVAEEANVEKINQKHEEDQVFVPLLAGISKTRNLPNYSNHVSQNSGRTTNAAYRPDIFSNHELSTIMELDTPDAGSRTQSSMKSQAQKSSINQKLPASKNFVQNTPRKSLTPRTSTPTKSSTDDINKGITKTKDDDTPSSEVTKHYTNSQTPNNSSSVNEKEKTTSTSSNGLSGVSGISEITSTSTSDGFKSEGMEKILIQNNLGWAVSTLKKTRETAALESTSTNSDITPVNTARRTISPVKKQSDSVLYDFPGLTDLSSISMKDASKSTEQAVLRKARTSTPNIQQFSSSSTKRSNSSSSSTSLVSIGSDTLNILNLSLSRNKTDIIIQKNKSQ